MVDVDPDDLDDIEVDEEPEVHGSYGDGSSPDPDPDPDPAPPEDDDSGSGGGGGSGSSGSPTDHIEFDDEGTATGGGSSGPIGTSRGEDAPRPDDTDYGSAGEHGGRHRSEEFANVDETGDRTSRDAERRPTGSPGATPGQVRGGSAGVEFDEQGQAVPIDDRQDLAAPRGRTYAERTDPILQQARRMETRVVHNNPDIDREDVRVTRTTEGLEVRRTGEMGSASAVVAEEAAAEELSEQYGTDVSGDEVRTTEEGGFELSPQGQRRVAAERLSDQTGQDVDTADVEVRPGGQVEFTGGDGQEEGGLSPEAEAEQGVEEQIQDQYPGFDRGDEYRVVTERVDGEVQARAELTESGERIAVNQQVYEQGIDPSMITGYERNEQGELEPVIDMSQGSLRQRVESGVSPVVQMATSGQEAGIPGLGSVGVPDRTESARRGEQAIWEAAMEGNTAAQLYAGGEAIQYVGEDVAEGVEGATEGALGTLGEFGLQYGTVPSLAVSAADRAGIAPEGTQEFVGGVGEEIGEQVASGVGMAAGGALTIGGAVAQTPVAVGGIGEQIASGRDVEDVGTDVAEGIGGGTLETGQMVASEPAAAATLLATPYAARAGVRGVGSGARATRTAAQRAAQVDAESVMSTARAQGRAAASRTRAAELLSDTRAQAGGGRRLRPDGGQQLQGRTRGQGQSGRQRVEVAEEGAGSPDPPVSQRLDQLRYRYRQEGGSGRGPRITWDRRTRSQPGEEIVTRRQAEDVASRVGMSRSELAASEVGQLRGQIESAIARRRQSQLVEGGRVAGIRAGISNYEMSPAARARLRPDVAGGAAQGAQTAGAGMLGQAQRPSVDAEAATPPGVVEETGLTDAEEVAAAAEETVVDPAADAAAGPIARMEEAQQTSFQGEDALDANAEDTSVLEDTTTGAGQRQDQAQETVASPEEILSGGRQGQAPGLDDAQTPRERIGTQARTGTDARTRTGVALDTQLAVDTMLDTPTEQVPDTPGGDWTTPDPGDGPGVPVGGADAEGRSGPPDTGSGGWLSEGTFASGLASATDVWGVEDEEAEEERRRGEDEGVFSGFGFSDMF